MAMIQFTKNYTDRSNDTGFQFEFFCDKCGNGFISRFQNSTLGVASKLLKAAGSIFGGVLGQAAYAGDHVKDALRGKAWDDAFAVAEAADDVLCAAIATPEMFCAISDVPRAASPMLRWISLEPP